MTRPPVRLVDQDGLAGAERALLEAARRVPPIHYDVAAGAARFQQTLSALGTTQGAVASVTGAKLSVAAKLTLLLVPTFGLLGAFVALRGGLRDAIVDNDVEQANVNEASFEAHGEALAEVTGPAAIAHPTTTVEQPAAITTRRRLRASRAGHREQAVSSARATEVADAHAELPEATQRATVTPSEQRTLAHDPLAVNEEVLAREIAPASTQTQKQAPGDVEAIDELRGIAQARAKVTQDPAQALALLQRVARAHPQGYFVEEREALTIIALAGIGDQPQALRRGREFLRKSPRSPFASRVRAAITH